MPNWCSNKMKVRGPEEKLEAMLAKVSRNAEGELQFLQSLWPMPEELRDTVSPSQYDPTDPGHRELLARYGAVNWYDWANSAQGWGTKWGDCHTEVVERSPGEAALWFETAWGPAIAGVVNVSTQWGELAFCLEYSEPMMGFAGEIMIQNGRVVASREWEVELYSEDEEAGELAEIPATLGESDDTPF